MKSLLFTKQVLVPTMLGLMLLVFARSGIAQDEEYVVLPFYLDNNECSGEINLVFPKRYLLHIVGA